MENSKYIIVRELSKGGQGTVYRGFDKAVGRPVAIKEFTYKNEGEKHRIEENIKAAKLCFHPALPGILDIYEYPGKICMVMEFIKGMTLQEYVETHGALPIETVIKIAERIGDVLSYLHGHNGGMIYSDLKPENIMIDGNFNIRLIDTGSIVSLNEDAASGCYASYGFASPEQVTGKRLTTRSDIFSLGALIHYMLTAENPSLPPYIRRRLKECNRALPAYLVKAVEKSLETESSKRFPTVESMLTELKNPKRRIIPFGSGFGQSYKQEKLVFVSSGKPLGVLALLAIAIIAGVIASGSALTAKAKSKNPSPVYAVQEVHATDQAGNHITLGKLSK